MQLSFNNFELTNLFKSYEVILLQARVYLFQFQSKWANRPNVSFNFFWLIMCIWPRRAKSRQKNLHRTLICREDNENRTDIYFNRVI